ncbi:hypothetical protein F383_00893 [Gossypium arboreum]|nr:hypothetical protein F383_00893 [Gossypium arboreum]
MIICFF